MHKRICRNLVSHLATSWIKLVNSNQLRNSEIHIRPEYRTGEPSTCLNNMAMYMYIYIALNVSPCASTLPTPQSRDTKWGPKPSMIKGRPGRMKSRLSRGFDESRSWIKVCEEWGCLGGCVFGNLKASIPVISLGWGTCRRCTMYRGAHSTFVSTPHGTCTLLLVLVELMLTQVLLQFNQRSPPRGQVDLHVHTWVLVTPKQNKAFFQPAGSLHLQPFGHGTDMPQGSGCGMHVDAVAMTFGRVEEPVDLATTVLLQITLSKSNWYKCPTRILGMKLMKYCFWIILGGAACLFSVSDAHHLQAFNI